MKALSLIALAFVLSVSGCSESGQIVWKPNDSADMPDFNEIGQPEHEPVSEQPSGTESAGETGEVEPAEEGEEDARDEVKTPQADIPEGCEGITCPDSITICNDGYRASRENTCLNGVCTILRPSCEGHDLCEGMDCGRTYDTCPDGAEIACDNGCVAGECMPCEPDCSGHAAEEPEHEEEEECELSCGICEELDEEQCVCDIIMPCDGNGICEEGEYPESYDCPDCSDSSECTEDTYDFGSRSCSHAVIVPCCGNTACEDEEDADTCPEDCAEEPEQPEETEEPAEGDVVITDLDPINEWLKIENQGSSAVTMTDWFIDDTLTSPRTVFVFPDFELGPGDHVFVMKGFDGAEDNETHLYRNMLNVWNNPGDTAVLMDSDGTVMSTFSYG